jgi:hypothetical protein
MDTSTETETPSEQLEKSIQHHTAETLLLGSLVSVSSLQIGDFPEDQQKEARVLLKELKEKIRKLRGML